MKNLQPSPHVVAMVEAGWHRNTGDRRFRTDFGSAMKREGLGGFGIAMELAQGDLQEKIYGLRDFLKEERARKFLIF